MTLEDANSLRPTDHQGCLALADALGDTPETVIEVGRRTYVIKIKDE